VKPGGVWQIGAKADETMLSPFVIACGAVVAVIALLIGASLFGVSRRALEAEMRQTDEQLGESQRDRDDADIAA
jgi:hypothetical protein